MLSMRATERIGGTGQRAAFDAGIFADLPETPAHNDASLHRVVIVGGGAAGLELAARLGREFGKRRRASAKSISAYWYPSTVRTYIILLRMDEIVRHAGAMWLRTLSGSAQARPPKSITYHFP